MIKVKFKGIEFISFRAAAKYFKIDPHVFRLRYRRGFRGKDLFYRGHFQNDPTKEISIVLKECIDKLKEFEKKKKIKNIEDWYKIPFSQLKKPLATYLKRKSTPIDVFLTKFYPKYNFLPWLFSPSPNGVFDSKLKRTNYVKWLRKRLKIKKLSDFYKIDHISLISPKKKLYGTALFSTYNYLDKNKRMYSLYALLKEVYPKYPWKFWMFNMAPTKSWEKIENQKEFFNWVLKKEKINTNTDDIYRVSFKMLSDYGGRSLSRIYKTFFDFMEKMFPDKRLIKYKFFHIGNKHYDKKENQREALVYLGEILGFKKKKDWYGISAPDFKNNGFDQLLRLYNHSPKKIVTNILSEYKFDVTKFDFSSKYEFRARCYAKCLFGQKEIIANAKLKIFESKKSGRSLELDIWVPKFNIAIEYQGEQHFKKAFNTQEQFDELKQRDRLKKRIAKKNSIKIIELKWKIWDGLPESFIETINKFYFISERQKLLFWKRFKKEDLFKDILKESKNIELFLKGEIGGLGENKK